MNRALSIALPSATRHVHLKTIGSTNAYALENDVDWVTADVQTAGRGRRGRVWSSPPGNLYASVRLIHEAATDELLPLRAALAVHDAVATLLPDAEARLSLKWPNDLLLDGRKVAGLLLEARSVGTDRIVAAGFGVNCATHPADAMVRATDFGAAGFDLDPQQLFRVLAAALAARLTASDIVAEWRARADGIGSSITVRLPSREIEGRFTDLAPDGRLVLARHDGTIEHIAAGDVFFDKPRGTPMTFENRA